jgi:SAM-dependent methyltransferase
VPQLFRQIRRLARNRGKWEYDSFGRCASCGETAFFVNDLSMRNWMAGLTASWDLSAGFKAALADRENGFCLGCSANIRMRAHAATVLRLLGMARVGELVSRLRRDRSFRFYETAAYNIFRARWLRELPGYVVSEYFDDLPPGTFRNGVRCEDLECLTFPDGHFDIVVNSDVLEHVHHLDKALAEVRRVLRPGGFHVFTVPVDLELERTRDRARAVNGQLVQLLPAILHGDTVREGGVPVLRDFGRDVLAYMSREGMQCREELHYQNGRPVASVFYARRDG